MALQKIKTKSFELKKDATAWAKKEKDKLGPTSGAKWETNRTDNTERPWEGVVFKDV